MPIAIAPVPEASAPALVESPPPSAMEFSAVARADLVLPVPAPTAVALRPEARLERPKAELLSPEAWLNDPKAELLSPVAWLSKPMAELKSPVAWLF